MFVSYIKFFMSKICAELNMISPILNKKPILFFSVYVYALKCVYVCTYIHTFLFFIAHSFCDTA